MTERQFKYVPHHCREQAEAEGWRFSADLKSHHSAYASLYERDVNEKDETLVQIVITKTKGGALRVVEFSSTSVLDTKEFTQPEVMMMILGKRVDDLTAV